MKSILKKFYQLWLKFGHILGTINAFIIMTALYFVVIGPISILLRIFGVDVMIRKRPAETNWMPLNHQKSDFESYKRMS